MSKLDDSFLKHFEYLNKVEGKPVCYKDFESFNVDGTTYYMMHGTFRNKISRLIKEGLAELYYNSKISFYVLRGVRFGKATSPIQMEPYCYTCHSCHARNDGIECPVNNLTKAIESLPKENNGLHDIHLKFQAQDMWTVLSESGKHVIDPNNKGIKLQLFNINNMRIILIIYPTDTCRVTVACSDNPVYRYIDDIDSIFRLATSLARVQERLQRIVDEAGMSLLGGYEQILIPDTVRWEITMCHFASDSLNFKETNFCVTWKDGQRVLYRVYSKKLKNRKANHEVKKNGKNGQSTIDSNGKYNNHLNTAGNFIIRSERQVYPSKTLGEMFKDELYNTKHSRDMGVSC